MGRNRKRRKKGNIGFLQVYTYVYCKFISMYMGWGGVCVSTYVYGDFVSPNPVARLVGWRVSLRVNLHYPGMEFPIAVVAREIAALWRLEGQWQILMGIYG